MRILCCCRFFKVRTSLFESLFPPEHYKLTHYLFSTPYWKKINTIFSFLTKISVSFWDEHLQCVWRRCCDMLSVIIVIYTEPPPVNTSAYFRVKSPLRPFFKLFWNDRNISGLKSWPTSVRWIFFSLQGCKNVQDWISSDCVVLIVVLTRLDVKPCCFLLYIYSWKSWRTAAIIICSEAFLIYLFYFDH